MRRTRTFSHPRTFGKNLNIKTCGGYKTTFDPICKPIEIPEWDTLFPRSDFPKIAFRFTKQEFVFQNILN
ncbi:hypothetical protein [Leptospira weilii]|uniref:hypothetical protein n=1 Tax=Leptospira weilii TaxID=28184 RepID=UPI0012DA2B3E|nr:hypothetical protein [Leptospira weilii]MCL8268041.1 hypothetical protein [Leptospira weilii]MDL5246705.1 hypothetical protein [Leptospira weilii]